MSDAELRELDREVAEKVMGWQWAVDECPCPSLNHGRCRKADGSVVTNFAPSTDIAAAWLVVEKALPFLRLIRHGGRTHREWWSVNWSPFVKCGLGSRIDGEEIARGDTAPEAICRAALKAVQQVNVRE